MVMMTLQSSALIRPSQTSAASSETREGTVGLCGGGDGVGLVPQKTVGLTAAAGGQGEVGAAGDQPETRYEG